MKIEWLVAYVMSFGSLSDRNVIFFGWFWTFFGKIRPFLWLGSHFVFWGSPEPWQSYLGPFNENWVVDCQCNICWVPCQSGTWNFGDDFRHFLANSGRFCGRGATLWSGNPLLSPNNFTQGHLMNMELLIADVTFVGSPARAECELLGMILDVFWPVQLAIVVGEPLCDLRIPSWALIRTLLRVF